MQAVGHITGDTAELYRRRLLPAAELLAAQSHAAGCEACRATLAGAVDLDVAFAAVRGEFAGGRGHDDEPEHLPHERLTAFVDGALDDVTREIVESHLVICAECAGDADDLRRYQLIAAAAPADITATAADTLVAAPAKPAGAWRRRLSSLNFMPSFGAFVPASAAAVVVVAALLGLWIAFRKNTDPNRGQVARVKPAEQDAAASPRTPAPQVDPTVIVTPAPAGTVTPAPWAESPAQESGRRENFAATPTRQGQPARPVRNSTPGVAAPDARGLRVALNDGGGGRVVFDSGGDLRGLETLSPDARGAVRRSLATRRVETPRALDGLARGAAGVLMSGATAPGAQGGVPFALVGPVGKVVREDRPVLRWRALAGAVSYRAAVVDANFQAVAESGPMPATEWTPPAALRRGQTYYWQVTATLADDTRITSPSSPAPQAKFRVLEADAGEELRRLEQSAPDSHLARGVLYARAGLLDEAESEFRQLIALNPRSPLARKLLRSVRK